MPLVAAEANQMLTTEATRLAYLSIHTADPGATGANEAAVARQALAWGTASAGSITAGQLSYTPPAGSYSYGGYWSALTGGTFLGSFQFLDGSSNPVTKTVATGDTLKVTAKLTETLA